MNRLVVASYPNEILQVLFPLIGDEKGEIASKIGMLGAGTDKKVTVRGAFVINPEKKVKAIICYPASTGRDFDEIIRSIDSSIDCLSTGCCYSS